MTELLEKLQSIFNEIGKVTITEEHMIILDNMRSQLKHLKGARSDYKFAMDTDCVFLEEYLICLGRIDPPLPEHRNKKGSCVYDGRIKLLNSVSYTDFKCIGKDSNFNVSSEKFKKKNDNKSTMDWVHSGVIDGLLTDYCFYKMHRPEYCPLHVGDKVTFELINVLNSRFVLKSLSNSVKDPGGKFYKVEKYDN